MQVWHYPTLCKVPHHQKLWGSFLLLILQIILLYFYLSQIFSARLLMYTLMYFSIVLILLLIAIFNYWLKCNQNDCIKRALLSQANGNWEKGLQKLCAGERMRDHLNPFQTTKERLMVLQFMPKTPNYWKHNFSD